MSTKTEQILKALKLHTSATNQNMLSPFLQRGNYIATDGQSLMCIPSSVCNLDIEHQDKPNCDRFISPAETMNVVIHIDELRANMLAVGDFVDEVIPTSKKCIECYGEGEVTCDYDHEHDCPRCNGTGYAHTDKPTGNKIPNPETFFLIAGSFFRRVILERLVKTADAMKVNTVTKVSGTEKSPAYFRVDRATVLLMPALNINDEPQHTLY